MWPLFSKCIARGAMNVLMRDIEKTDYDFVLRLNKENVEVLAPLTEEKLEYFSRSGDMVKVVSVDGEPAAFFIVLREGVSDYESENYIWFSKEYDSFLYIDRIVIDEPFRRAGLGRQIYEAVFDRAKECGVPRVTAEIDTIPYNEASLKFHEAMGFKEVGIQSVRRGTIQVSLQVRDI